MSNISLLAIKSREGFSIRTWTETTLTQLWFRLIYIATQSNLFHIRTYIKYHTWLEIQNNIFSLFSLTFHHTFCFLFALSRNITNYKISSHSNTLNQKNKWQKGQIKRQPGKVFKKNQMMQTDLLPLHLKIRVKQSNQRTNQR